MIAVVYIFKGLIQENYEVILKWYYENLYITSHHHLFCKFQIHATEGLSGMFQSF